VTQTITTGETMEGNTEIEKDKLFKLELKVRKTTFKLEIPVELPFEETRIPEFTQLIITSFNLPILFENEIEDKLREFVEKENFEFLMEQATVKPDEIEANIQSWEQAYREETLQYNPPEVVGDDEVFAEAYHALVHSPLLGSVLRKESAFNSTVREMHRCKYQEISALNEKQNKEMASTVSQSGVNSTANVNSLAAVHFDNSSLVRTRWESILESENLKQKREFRDWIVHTYQDYYIEAAEEQNQNQKRGKGMKKKLSVRFDETLMISYGDDDHNETSANDGAILQESFTIHLGSQMKQMYNIRLMCCHPKEFLRFKNESSRELSPQRLQTAISLYSTDLSGLVLLVDSDFSIYRGVLKDLIQLCQQSTEFHFENVETQLETRSMDFRPAKPGDFFITRHSNLNGVHVIFHLVANQQSLKRSEINSRHAVILGLRNILKTACLNDITTITVPALLTHDIEDFMTDTWCNRRAELVYKCVKGFMIEMTSWGGADMKNLQFLAPKDTTEATFSGLAAMLPNVFRVSNPLRLSSSSSSHNLQP